MGGKRRMRNGNSSFDEGDEIIMTGFESVYMWSDPMVSAPTFLSVLVLLLSLCYYSLLSVVAYTSLFLLGALAGVKLYVYVMNTFLKKNVNDPIATFAAYDFTVSEERVNEFSTSTAERFNFAATELRRLFFVEDLVDSVKFALSLWFLTYIGGWFNAMTLLILAWTGLFTIPKIYQNNHQTLDPILTQIKGHLSEVNNKVNAIFPKKAAPAAATAPETKKEE